MKACAPCPEAGKAKTKARKPCGLLFFWLPASLGAPGRLDLHDGRWLSGRRRLPSVRGGRPVQAGKGGQMGNGLPFAVKRRAFRGCSGWAGCGICGAGLAGFRMAGRPAGFRKSLAGMMTKEFYCKNKIFLCLKRQNMRHCNKKFRNVNK
jgi:hypothetical protein